MQTYFKMALIVMLVTTSWNVASPSLAKTIVTTITETQEERQSTRWTLTEWLRIKERIKMMDLWLAMFSNPNKDKPRLELSLTGSKQRGEYKLTSESLESTNKTNSGTGKAQLWMTNLFTSTFGLRLLNVDLGAEGYLRETVHSKSTLKEIDETYVPLRKESFYYYTGNLRLFGKNIQDSALVLKYGRYRHIFDDVTKNKVHISGTLYGGELQLYIFKWLGAEGQYLVMRPATAHDHTYQGTNWEYGPFIEVSLIRLMFGWYNHEWKMTHDVQPTSISNDKGIFAAIKVQL